MIKPLSQYSSYRVVIFVELVNPLSLEIIQTENLVCQMKKLQKEMKER